ncbi:concanavalin A-like lectin/glucanase domain-containing protein [Rhizophagus diaphanus]|nr:concanavalin A-like lectin/glucanase domain-containing protein [Rhizophagus diaphanus] [Rhizophagus sp. MUCL 43196]
MPKFAVKEWAEIISGPISMREQDQQVFEHADLPAVKDKLSVTLRLKIHNHHSDWAAIFHKGRKYSLRLCLWLAKDKSGFNARFSGNWHHDAGIYEPDNGLLLNKWYHIAYTLSDPEKRLDIYIDGEWFEFYSILKVKEQKVIFNDGPLYVGRSFNWKGFNGEISNFRYFNWRLSAEEVMEDFFNESQKKPIVYGSKIALVHVSTRKYLSTKGIKYDLGPNNEQYMVICSGQEINLKNDVWTVTGASGKNINEGDLISLNNIIGFKHQATGCYLHSHDTSYERVTPISQQQQVTLCSDRGSDVDWLVRRYNSTTSYDTGHLMSGDIIGLFHISTNKQALYSHAVLLGDRSQEVSCYGDGSEKNNRWRIELIN